MQKQSKISEILDFIQGLPSGEDSIPVAWWINNPQGVADRLNAYAQKMGLKERFTADQIGRKSKKS